MATTSELKRIVVEQKKQLDMDASFIRMSHKLDGKKARTSSCYVEAVVDALKFLSRVLDCKVFGHHMVDEGYATAESGCRDIRCTRCGWGSGRTWLY